MQVNSADTQSRAIAEGSVTVQSGLQNFRLVHFGRVSSIMIAWLILGISPRL